MNDLRDDTFRVKPDLKKSGNGLGERSLMCRVRVKMNKAGSPAGRTLESSRGGDGGELHDVLAFRCALMHRMEP